MKGTCPSGYNEDLPMSCANGDDEDELSSGLVVAVTIDSCTLVNTICIACQSVSVFCFFYLLILYLV